MSDQIGARRKYFGASNGTARHGMARRVAKRGKTSLSKADFYLVSVDTVNLLEIWPWCGNMTSRNAHCGKVTLGSAHQRGAQGRPMRALLQAHEISRVCRHGDFGILLFNFTRGEILKKRLQWVVFLIQTRPYRFPLLLDRAVFWSNLRFSFFSGIIKTADPPRKESIIVRDYNRLFMYRGDIKHSLMTPFGI